jgi:hypothetical protein
LTSAECESTPTKRPPSRPARCEREPTLWAGISCSTPADIGRRHLPAATCWHTSWPTSFSKTPPTSAAMISRSRTTCRVKRPPMPQRTQSSRINRRGFSRLGRRRSRASPTRGPGRTLHRPIAGREPTIPSVCRSQEPERASPVSPFPSMDQALSVWASLSNHVPLFALSGTRCGEVKPVWDEYFAASSTPFAFSSHRVV